MSSMPQHRVVLSRSRIVGTIVILFIALTCARLGLWQLDRLAQKRQSNGALETRMRESVVQLQPVPMDTAGLIFRRTVLTGEYDEARTIVLAGRSFDGNPGVHLVTPLRIGGGAVLVNRGWIPSADAAHIDIAAFREPSPQELEALIVMLPYDPRTRADTVSSFRRVWHRHPSIEALQQHTPYRLAPYIAQLLPSTAAPDGPHRLAPPKLDEGPHLGYAIQWFSFAAIAIIGWIIVLVRGTGRPRQE